MKSLKKLLATATLTGIIILGTANTHAGIIFDSFTKSDTNQPCVEKVEKKRNVNHGIIFDSVGIIFDSVGIIFDSLKKDAPTNCGIIFDNRK